MGDLTVLANQNDPFRVDTPARHRDGEWLATTAADLGLGDRKIHLRGLHYMVLGREKPDGSPYSNTAADWQWLVEDAGKAARWLGYIGFEQIVDQRNAEPDVRIFTRPEPWPYLSVGIDVDIPSAADIEPRVDVDGFLGAQPHKLVLIGEKSSLADVLAPISREYKADLYLPTGECSDTLLHRMATIGAADGRPMVVLYFSDCDPSGWQMPISVARKLQALKALSFPDLEFQVHRVALTPTQVRDLDLPSAPLKDTERRADRWQTATGVAQTEIDALASLRPDVLAGLARRAIGPFYDATLDERVFSAYSRWLDQAQAEVDRQLDAEHLREIRASAAARLSELREQVDAINSALRIDVENIELPVPVVPAARVDTTVHGTPLIDSRWPFAEQTQRLIESKAYRGDGGEPTL